MQQIAIIQEYDLAAEEMLGVSSLGMSAAWSTYEKMKTGTGLPEGQRPAGIRDTSVPLREKQRKDSRMASRKWRQDAKHRLQRSTAGKEKVAQRQKGETACEGELSLSVCNAGLTC